MALIPEETLEQIRLLMPIEALIQEYLPLQRRGRNFVGLCPFHNEKSPSFNVTPERGMYKCFGCGKSGNIYTFLMEKEGLSFVEAVEELARRTGVTIKRSGYQEGTRRKVEEKDRLVTLIAKIEEWFHKQLFAPGGRYALEYLLKRGLSEETMRLYRLGLAPPDWESLVAEFGGSVTKAKDLETLGLARLRKSGQGYYDFFRNRVMFPIHDLQGRVIAFGGRILPSPTPNDKEPKYSNSPETLLFKKSQTLYGLHQAKDAIRKNDHAYLVEGYMDLVMARQHGVEDVVASLGTALTEGHGKLLSRFTKRATFLYDGDSAGQKATLRGLRVFLPQDFVLKAITLPEGHDPDSYLQAKGKGSLERLKEQAPDGIAFAIRTIAAGRDTSAAAERKAIIKACAEYMATPLLREEVERQLASFLRIGVDLVRYETNRERLPYKQAAPQASSAPPPLEPVKIHQRRILALMLSSHEIALAATKQLLLQDFTGDEYRTLARRIFELIEQGQEVRPEGLFDFAAQEGILDLYEEIMGLAPEHFEDMPMEGSLELDLAVKQLRIRELEGRMAALRGEITAALEQEDNDRAFEAMARRRELAQELNRLRDERSPTRRDDDVAF